MSCWHRGAHADTDCFAKRVVFRNCFQWILSSSLGFSLPIDGPSICDANWGDLGIHKSQKFRKGVGGQRGLARGAPSQARDSDLFSVLFFLFLATLRRRGTQFWGPTVAVCWALLVANPLLPTPFRNLWKGGAQKSGVRKRVVSKRVVLADVPRHQKPERGYIRMFPST